MDRLKDKVAIITGSARGMGREMALRFAAEGADIAVSDILVPRMEETAEEVRGLGRKAIAVKTDVSKKEDAERLVAAAIDTFSKVDILVNNAGIVRTGALEDIAEKDWDDIFNVNLKGTFFCIQAVMKHMIARKYGKIINMSSTTGMGSNNTELAHYACSKAGVMQLTKVAARALGQYGINVNSISPGVIRTEMSQNVSEEFLQTNLRATVLGRFGTPADIANLAAYLASDESSFMTGQIIPCNGGRIDLM